MSVVIKGMELPDGCLNCKLFNGTGCMATMTMFPKWMNVAVRPKDCPMSDYEELDKSNRLNICQSDTYDILNKMDTIENHISDLKDLEQLLSKLIMQR